MGESLGCVFGVNGAQQYGTAHMSTVARSDVPIKCSTYSRHRKGGVWGCPSHPGAPKAIFLKMRCSAFHFQLKKAHNSDRMLKIAFPCYTARNAQMGPWSKPTVCKSKTYDM